MNGSNLLSWLIFGFPLLSALYLLLFKPIDVKTQRRWTALGLLGAGLASLVRFFLSGEAACTFRSGPEGCLQAGLLALSVLLLNGLALYLSLARRSNRLPDYEFLAVVDAAWAGTEAPDAAPLFASDGQPTARLRELAGVAERYHREAVATASRCADLAAAGVLAPAPMRAAMPGSAALWLDRERLKRLAPAALRQLIDGGALELAFPALWSLEALAPSGTDARRYRAWLIQQVQGLGVRYGVEDSLQIGAGGITVDRFLVSLPKSALGDAAHARLLHLCRGLAMPPALLRRYQSCLPDADHCYFGWECRDGRVRLKAYLEYFQRWRAEKPVAPGPGRDVLMVLAFKWQADAPAQYGVTRYRWHPELSAAQVRGRALDLMTAGRGGPLADVCRHLLDAALDPAVPADDETGSGTALRFLEVTDDGSDRHSFDINLYRRGRRVADIEQSLRGLAAALGLAEQDLAADLAAIRGDSLGHVSGGRNRHGQPFVTVYHGMRFGSGPDGPVPRSPA